MAALTEATLTVVATDASVNGLKFLFRAISPLQNVKEQPALSSPLVNQGSGNNILFRFNGQVEKIDFTFAIFDDGVDVAAGTHSSTVKTVAEQIQYLRDNIFDSSFDTSWTIVQARYYPTAITGVISNVKFDNPAGSGSVVTGSFTFMRGRIIQL